MSTRTDIDWQIDHRLTPQPQWPWSMVLCFSLHPVLPSQYQTGQGRNTIQMACDKKGLLIPARGASICTRPLRWNINGVTLVGNIWDYVLSFLTHIVNKISFDLAKQNHLCWKRAYKIYRNICWDIFKKVESKSFGGSVENRNNLETKSIW